MCDKHKSSKTLANSLFCQQHSARTPTLVQGKVEISRNVSWDCNPSRLCLARTFTLWCSATVPATVINIYIHTTTHTSLLTYWNPPFYIYNRRNVTCLYASNPFSLRHKNMISNILIVLANESTLIFGTITRRMIGSLFPDWRAWKRCGIHLWLGFLDLLRNDRPGEVRRWAQTCFSAWNLNISVVIVPQNIKMEQPSKGNIWESIKNAVYFKMWSIPQGLWKCECVFFLYNEVLYKKNMQICAFCPLKKINK